MINIKVNTRLVCDVDDCHESIDMQHNADDFREFESITPDYLAEISWSHDFQCSSVTGEVKCKRHKVQ